MASIELEDLIKQSVTQLNRKLAVEKERDNCIILSSMGFHCSERKGNAPGYFLALRHYRQALLAKNIIRHSATTTIIRTVAPSTKIFIVMLSVFPEHGISQCSRDIAIWIITGGGMEMFGQLIAKAFPANGVKVYITERRLDVLEQAATIQVDIRRRSGAKHIEEVGGKNDILVNKFIAYVPTKAALVGLWQRVLLGGVTGAWSEQLSAEVLGKSIPYLRLRQFPIIMSNLDGEVIYDPGEAHVDGTASQTGYVDGERCRCSWRSRWTPPC
ncbi:hypothetical protein EV421DRAFT_1738178 [Armillaria borealis]|uniref:Uncharacterized protein n=1 Tax=Armillaria borealis TaxID=47425 RepID=A0AA39MLS0_9AGAR|nr:hypothetical protein EV421DRAFT_1738178 [Armillaria borealis]